MSGELRENEEIPAQSKDAVESKKPVPLEELERELSDKRFSDLSLDELIKTRDTLDEMKKRAEDFASKLELVLLSKSRTKTGEDGNAPFIRREEKGFIDRAAEYQIELDIVEGLIASKGGLTGKK